MMNRLSRRNIVSFASGVAGAFALTLALLLPGTLHADKPELPTRLAVNSPHVAIDGVEVSVQLAEGAVARAGEPLRLVVVAKNTTDAAVTIHPMIQLQSTGVASRMSRVMPMPKTIWSAEQAYTLGAGGEQTFALSPDVALSADTNLSVVIQNAKESSIVLALSTAKQ